MAQKTSRHVVCKSMTQKHRADAYLLLDCFLRTDTHYLATRAAYGDRGPPALNRALQLFLRQPKLGFVWLAYIMEEPVAVCVVSYAISTSIGGVVAKVDDVYVSRRRQRRGIATQMLEDLKKELRKRNVLRIDTAVHKRNHSAAKFYSKLGFERLDEERLVLVL